MAFSDHFRTQALTSYLKCSSVKQTLTKSLRRICTRLGNQYKEGFTEESVQISSQSSGLDKQASEGCTIQKYTPLYRNTEVRRWSSKRRQKKNLCQENSTGFQKENLGSK